MVFELLQTSHQNLRWVGVEKSFLMCFCEEKRFPEASFPALLAEQFFVFKSHFWECLNIEIICLIEFGVENENIFWMLICERRIFQHCNFVLGIARHTFNCFQIIFSMSPLICLNIVGWVRCVKPSFASNLRTNDLFGKFFPFKTVCDWRLLGFKFGFWSGSDVNSRNQVEGGKTKLCIWM